MSDTPQTSALLDQILERDGELNERNAPAAWVQLCKRLERKHAADLKELNQRLIERHRDMLKTIVDLREELAAERRVCGEPSDRAAAWLTEYQEAWSGPKTRWTKKQRDQWFEYLAVLTLFAKDFHFPKNPEPPVAQPRSERGTTKL